MGYLPFENTTISARRSISEIQDLLDRVGFEKTATITDKGHHSIIAMYKSAQFQFDMDINEIITALINETGERTQAAIRRKDRRGREVMEKIQSQAEKVGWRFMFEHIKTVADGIRLRVISPSQAFAGYALITDKKTGRAVTLSSVLTAAIEDGTRLSPDILALPERTGGQ